MNKYTPAQRRSLEKIKKKRQEIEAELSVSQGLYKDAKKRLKEIICINAPKIKEVERYFSRLFQENSYKIETIEKSQIAVEVECIKHEDDIKQMTRELAELRTEQYSIKPAKNFCMSCGQEVPK